MRLQLKLLIAALLVTRLVSCTDVKSTEDVNLNKGFAPLNIVGKTYDWEAQVYYSSFTNSGSFTVNGTGGQIIGTPAYTYKKLNENQAILTTNYTYKNNTSTYNDYFCDTLTFSSAGGGTHKGKGYIQIVNATGKVGVTGSGSFTLK